MSDDDLDTLPPAPRALIEGVRSVGAMIGCGIGCCGLMVMVGLLAIARAL
jgi:hypothetical protein